MLITLGFHEASLSKSAKALLRHALFGEPGKGLVIAPAGQHDPGRAGGFNQGAGVEQKKFPVNPWAIILAFEGGLFWSSGVSRFYAASFGIARKGSSAATVAR